MSQLTTSHIEVRVPWKSPPGLHGVVTPDPSRMKSRMIGVKIVRKRKSEPRLQPAVIGLAPLISLLAEGLKPFN